MESAMLTVRQHRQWLAPQEWQRSRPWQSRHSAAHTCIAHLNNPQSRHCLSSFSAISAFSSELISRHTAMCVRNTVAYSGGGCHAKLAQGIATELYIVKRGDWLSDVAAARNMDVYDLKELNPKLDLDNIYVGQEIIVPILKPAEPPPPLPPPLVTDPSASAPDPSASAPLAVNNTPPTQARDKAGGNLLGNLFGRQEANAVEPALSKNVQAEVLADPEDDFKLEVYTMKRGEWVSSVASRFGVSLDELRAANPNVNLDNVRPKQTILIPRPTHLPDPVKSLAQPDICAPSSTPQPPSLGPQQLTAKPSASDNRPASDMCAPPSPKQGTPLLDGKKQQAQKQQQQQAKKGGGNNSKNESDMCCPPAAPASQQSMSGPGSPSTEVYVVKRGDWMSTVAAERGLSLDELRQLNPGINLDRVRTGQEILVPRKESAAAAAALLPAVPDENIATEYMIQPGDYVDTIAQQHGVSIDDIVELNSLSYEEPIQVGQTIFIPKPRPPEFELTTSTLAAELGPPPVSPLVVGGLVGVGTALLTIAAIGFALTERSPTAAPAGGGSSGGGGAPGSAGSGQVRGRPVVVAAEGAVATGGSGAATESPVVAAAAPVPRQESREARPVKLGSSPNGSSNGSGFVNGNGAVRSQSGGGGVSGTRGSKVFRGSEATSSGLPPEVERATLAAVEAVRGGTQGLGALRVGDGYARAESLTGALQEAVRAAVVSLGSAQPTVAIAAISGGGGDADAASHSRTEEAVLHLKKILPRDCTLHGVNAGGGDASPSRDEGSQAWAAVLLLSAPDVIVSSSVGLGYGGARLASQQAIESLASKVHGKKQLKSVVVNASPGLGPTAVEEVASMLPGVPAYNVSAGRGMATSEWQVVAGPTASTVSPGISAIGLTTDAEFGGAFLATVTAQWLYGSRSVVAARPPTIAISRS